MAAASPDSKMEDDDVKDEKTNSSLACLMLEIATILSVATVEPTQFGHYLGLSENKVAEIDSGLEDPKSKIIHILERFRDRHGDDWQVLLQEIVKEKLEDPSLVQKLEEVTNNQNRATSEYPEINKGSIIEGAPKSMSGREQGASSRHSSASGWDMGSGSKRSHGNDDTSSESFERLSEENVFQSRDEHPSNEEIPHQSLDHPEMSLQISKVGEALQVVSDLLGNVEGINQLAQVIPQILRLVRQMKSQKMLRHVFEEENSNLKQDLQGANEFIRELRATIENLEMEVQDLKKANEDKSLKDFDVVTRKEASDMKKEETKHDQKTSSAQTPTQTSTSEGGVSIEAYETLQKKIITLKQKLAQVVKLNHSWDEQDHRMELALKQELEKNKVMMQEKNLEMERRDKERDEILSGAKHRMEELEAGKADLQKNLDHCKQQLAKVNRYAVSLQSHKAELETEVKRLNEVDVYKSDFYKQKRDRQRAMGEMEEVKTELHRAKKKMEKQKQELQILKDQTLAYQFHAKEQNRIPAAAPRHERSAQRPRSSAKLFYSIRTSYPHRRPTSPRRRSHQRLPSSSHLVRSPHLKHPCKMGSKRARPCLNDSALCRECRRPFFQREEGDECPRCDQERFMGLRREHQMCLDIGLLSSKAKPRFSVGLLLWKITSFTKLTKERNATGVNSVRSESLMTSQYGYKLCIQLDVFYNVLKNRQDIFLRPVILKGYYDATVAWPFKEKVIFKFINQNDLRKEISLPYRPDPESASSKKPTCDSNIASAGIVFPDVQRLQGFLKDGSLIVEVKCQTSDIPAQPSEDQVLSYQCQVSEDSE